MYFSVKAKKKRFIRDDYAWSKEVRRKSDIFDYNKFSFYNNLLFFNYMVILLVVYIIGTSINMHFLKNI